MKAVIVYLLQVIIASGILYGYYHWILRNKAFHRYNRYYLLAATLISLVIPFLNIPVYFTREETSSSIILETLTVISGTTTEIPVVVSTAPAPESSFDWRNLVWIAYSLIVALLLIRAVISLLRIRSIIRNNAIEQLDRINFVTTSEPGTPFSFFRWLFWNREIELQSPKGQQIFRHEVFHIEQKHSRDSVFMELLTTIGWINPFFHLIKKELRTIHEFLADEFSVRENEKWQYAELLLMQAFRTQQRFVNPFFHNQIKRRIAMITASKKPGHQYLRKLLVLPLAAIIVVLFAFSYRNKKAHSPLPDEKAITVVIDAGHGGADKGVIGEDGTLEKDIVLSIAQKVKTLNAEKNINIILTRNSDVSASLPSRMEAVTNNKADLLISLHINTAVEKADTKTGIEVAIPGKNKAFDAQNRQLASILLSQFSGLYPVSNGIVQKKEGIYVLDHSPCPSVLIECGYLSNKKDLAFISDANNQEEIARRILGCIEQYARRQTNPASIGQQQTYPDTLILIENYDGKQKLQDTSWKWTDGLLVIDGKIIPQEQAKMKVAGVFSGTINVLKGKAATDKYGEKGKKGVVEIITNKNGAVPVTRVETGAHMNADTTPGKIKIEPYFPGGVTKWNEYLQKNIKATIPVDSGAPAGNYTVVVQFMVHQDGKISGIKPLTKHGYGMEQEVQRIIAIGPKWEPVMINGKYVDAYKKQLVTFVVSEEPDDIEAVSAIKAEKGENWARFPGGEAKWKEYLQKNLNAAVPVQHKAPGGTYTVIIQVSFDTEGNIYGVKPLTKHGYGMEEEAIRIIKKGPKWEPAFFADRHIASTSKQRITFVVDDGDKSFPVTSLNTDHKPLQTGNKIFDKVEVAAQFPGGQEKWKLYLQTNLNTSMPAQRKAPDGEYTAVIQFVVNIDGTISGIRPLTKHGYGVEEEAIRILKNGPKWQPAIINGKQVAAYKLQPVTFTVGKGEKVSGLFY